MIKKYGTKILKSIKFIVALILMLTTIMFLCSCNIDPQNLDVWYLDGLIVDGQTYGVRDIYGTEYITSEYMTMAFKDGKVVFNKNGKIINGTYTYKDNIGCGTEKYDNNEVVVKLENGVTYTGSSHMYFFDGAWYKLELKNETETLYFCDERDEYTNRSGVNSTAYTVLQEIKYAQENFEDYTPIVYKISYNEQEKIIKDTGLVHTLLENLSEQIAHPYKRLAKDELTPENNFYKYTFQILYELNTDPVSYEEKYKVTFYYNSETEFFYEIENDSTKDIDGKTFYNNIECISGKNKSLYKYIVELFNAA